MFLTVLNAVLLNPSPDMFVVFKKTPDYLK